MLFLIDFDAGMSLVIITHIIIFKNTIINNCRSESGPLSLRNLKINAHNCSDHLMKH